MVTKADKIVFSLIILLAILTFFFLKKRNQVSANKVEVAQTDSKDDKKKEKKKDKGKNTNAAGVTITQKWDMPDDLQEISGIACISNNRFACVQDELGKIFIFNTASQTIEKEIPFGDVGDYEGIALVGTTAYVLRADGKLFEVTGYNSSKSSVVQHSTHLTAKQDVEGLCYDQKNNRLLLAIKGREPDSKDYKGIYAFSLSSKKLATTPVYKIDLTGNDPDGGKGKNKIQPSDLDIHPATGDIYIIDGPNSKLLVIGNDGTKKNLYQLSTSDFPQPEGIAFAQTGDLFISNEGGNDAGNILKVSVDSP